MTYEEIKAMEIPIGKAEDLSNQKFGQLTALFRVADKSGRVKWACQCDCGCYTISSTNELKSGKKYRCHNHAGKDITGQKFGYLTALHPTDERAGGNVVWLCKCDCGTEEKCAINRLQSGDKTRCKDHDINAMIGIKFGHLTVLSYSKSANQKRYYSCKCDCGNNTEVAVSDLTTGNTQSCGCQYKKDISGQVFGEVTALYPTQYRSNGSVIWFCKCSCGEYLYSSQHTLHIGKRVKCDNHYKNTIIGQKFGKLTAICYSETVNKTAYFWAKCDCGRIIRVRGNSLVSGNTQTCGYCEASIGEMNISNLLNDNNIPFIDQMKFDSCRFPDTNMMARFDFYVTTSKSFLVEFDGPQHDFEKNNVRNHPMYSEENLIKTRNHDLYKNQWAWDNGIPLKRIPYEYRDSVTIADILSDRFIVSPLTHPQYYPEPNSSYPYINVSPNNEIDDYPTVDINLLAVDNNCLIYNERW